MLHKATAKSRVSQSDRFNHVGRSPHDRACIQPTDIVRPSDNTFLPYSSNTLLLRGLVGIAGIHGSVIQRSHFATSQAHLIPFSIGLISFR